MPTSRLMAPPLSPHLRVRWAVGAISLVALALTAEPATRTPTVLAITALAAAAPLLGIRWFRPASALPWLAVAAMVGIWGVGLAIVPLSTSLAIAAQSAGLVIAGGLFVHLFARLRSARTQDRRRSRRETWGHRTDLLLVVTVVSLALAQSVTAALTPGTPWSVRFAPGDLVLICLILRLMASRAQLGPAAFLVLSGGLFAGVYDGLVADSGTRVLGTQAPVNLVWTAAMCLFLAAALHPSMPRTFAVDGLHLRSESARLIGLVPLVLVPIALSAMHPGGRLPTMVYLVTGAVVAGLAIVRGAQSVQYSEHRAQRDPLTGLANRRGLRTAFERLLVTAGCPQSPVGRLALLDLDDFKQVNDTWGHETGDQLLVAVGNRLQDAVGELGTVARSGGDEFVLLVRPDGPAIDEVLTTTFTAPFQLITGQIEQTFLARCSAGWVELFADSELPHALADADVALYATKDAAPGTATRFAPHQRATVLGRLALADDLRALFRGDAAAGSLVLHFQPLVALPHPGAAGPDVLGHEAVGYGALGHEVVGHEALVRWAHPTLGLLPPDDFLPLVEVQGLGADLDTWVLHRACAAAADWVAAGEAWTVSVNLGRSSMIDPDLACRVRGALSAAGLAPDRLHLEITEHDALPVDAGVEPLRTLAALGVGVDLDDFGTGYTSLAYLQRYPISVLKLDRSVTGVDSPTGLLAGVVGLADALGITVLAEGIETTEQCARLAELGVDRGQGWLFGRPAAIPTQPVADRVVRTG